MIKNCVISALFASAFFLFLSPDIRAGEPVEFAAGEILLKFKDGTSEAEKQNIFNKYSLTKIQFNPTIQTHLVLAKEDDVTTKISLLNQESSVEYAHPNYVKKKNSTPNDPYYSSQWYLPHIGMPTAWSEFTGTALVRVAVIDSGVKKALTDLTGVLISDGEWDYIDGDSNADDTNGHGTLIAGIIAATANNSLGVAGISSRARILPFRQDGFVSDINDAMVRAYNSGCKIINASYGQYTEIPAERAQISWLNDRGVLVVCSAGNAGTNNDTRRHYPDSYDLPNIISVANSTPSSVLSSSSNYGVSSVDIAAPGEDIFSTCAAGDGWNQSDPRFDINNPGYRGVIRNFSFNSSGESWQGYPLSTGGLGGFFWRFSDGGWITDYFLATGQYAVNSNFYVESPLIDCRGYLNINLLSTFSGGLGAGDLLGIYSGTAGWSNRVQSGSLVSGLVNGTYTRILTPLDDTIGRIWYWLTSDWFGNGYMEINNVEVSGVPIYTSDSGTSFAAPIVTGVAAMLMSQNPQLTHLQVKEIILQTARKVSALNGKVVSGGIVDAAAALRKAKARIVVAPVISSAATASGKIGTAFSYQITATGGATSYRATGLPAGLTVNTATGLISGKPTVAATTAVTVGATNGGGTGTKALTITVTVAAPVISSAATASGKIGTAFSYRITATGGATSYRATGLPAGLTVNTATGLISGKPTKVGRFSVTLQALKKGARTATATAVFTVVQVPTFTYAPTINAKKGKALKVSPTIAGYPAPTFSILTGRLPPGLSLNRTTAAITGTPTTLGKYPFTVRGSNSVRNTDRSVTIVVK